MSILRDAILITWKRNRNYAERMVAPLSDAQMIVQPVARVMMNHPAWILSHLNVYAPIAAAMLSRRAFEDPIDHPFGQKSAPSGDARVYPPRATLLADYLRLHDEALRALETADDSVFAEANPIERWRGMHPRIGDMLVTLMVKHESMHLGQLSAWRRAMGMPRVEM